MRRAAQTGGVEERRKLVQLLQELTAKGIYNPDQEIGGSMLDEFQTGLSRAYQGGIDYLFGNKFRRAKEFNENKNRC